MMGKMAGKAAWFGTWKLPTDKQERTKATRRNRAREKRNWKQEERNDHRQ